MLAPQSSVSRQCTTGYRPDLNTEIAESCSPDNVEGFESYADSDDAWTRACHEIKRHFEKAVSWPGVGKYIKTAAGLEGRCGNPHFEAAARMLGALTEPVPDLKEDLLPEQINLLVVIYVSVTGATNAFLKNGDLIQAAFMEFTVRYLEMPHDEVRDVIAAGRLDGIVLEEEARSAAGTESGVTERRVRLTGEEYWTRAETACGFDDLPAEMKEFIFEFLPSHRDHASLALTSHTTHEAVHKQLLIDWTAAWAKQGRSVCRRLALATP